MDVGGEIRAMLEDMMKCTVAQRVTRRGCPGFRDNARRRNEDRAISFVAEEELRRASEVHVGEPVEPAAARKVRPEPQSEGTDPSAPRSIDTPPSGECIVAIEQHDVWCARLEHGGCVSFGAAGGNGGP